MARILFVDDDQDTLTMLSRVAQILGHQVSQASSGQQALELVASDPPEIIFVDMTLPDMDGFTLIRSLQQKPQSSHIPALMLSAGPELDVAERAREAGARDFLNKPVRIQILQDVITRYTAQ